MKTFIVYVNGEETCLIEASGHNAAEKQAKKKFPGRSVNVVME